MRAMMVFVLVGLTIAAFPARSNATTTITLPNCLGKPEVRPSSIISLSAGGSLALLRLSKARAFIALILSRSSRRG